MDIKGLQKTTLVDYPGKVACAVFLPKCNFRCPYCQNPDLVEGWEKLPTIPEGELMDFLNSRKKWLDGVCITGGEPTVHSKLPDFAGRIKELGFLVKLDTNGTNPEMVGNMIGGGVLDYVAMDIKAPLGKYDAAAGVRADKDAIRKTAGLLMEGKIDYEFRTTVVPDFFSAQDAKAIGKWLNGGKAYFLQQFNPNTRLLNREFEGKKPYSENKLREFGEMLKPYFKVCGVRA